MGRRGIGLGRRVTLILLPKQGSQKSFEVWVPLLYAAGAFILLCAIGVGLLFNHYQYLQTKVAVLKKSKSVLRQVNFDQREDFALLTEEMLRLEEKLEELEALDGHLRDIMGLPEQEKLPAFNDNAVVVASFNGGDGSSTSTESAYSQAVGGAKSGVKFANVDRVLTHRVRGAFAVAAVNSSVPEERLSRLADKIDESIANLQSLEGKAVTYQDMRRRIPAGYPVDTVRITSEFGYRQSPFSSRREFHSGLDFAADYRDPVTATGQGIVTYAGWHIGYGRLVEITHGYGYKTRYGHLQQILVNTGESVARGVVIGAVGSTGRSTGPHLHYEVIKDNVLVDPRLYLDRVEE